MNSRKEQIDLRELVKKICMDDISHPILQDLDACIGRLSPNLPQKVRFDIILDILMKIAQFDNH